MNEFDKAICLVVRNIPAGHVMSYGEVARAAGFPRHARLVAKAMTRAEMPLPWHRVVKSNRQIAFPKGSVAYREQLARLREEGLVLRNGRVIGGSQDLDRLLWDMSNGG